MGSEPTVWFELKQEGQKYQVRRRGREQILVMKGLFCQAGLFADGQPKTLLDAAAQELMDEEDPVLIRVE